MHVRYLPLALLAAVVLAAGGGCGPGRLSKVEGTVTLDGQPLEGALVEFVPEGAGQPASGVTGSDGFFRLTTLTTGDGAAVGDYKVLIKKTEKREVGGVVKTDDPDSMKAAYGGFLKERRKRKPRDPKSEIPAMYGDAKQTPLKAHVPPDGSLKFELRSKGG